jgi:hypothetical protein
VAQNPNQIQTREKEKEIRTEVEEVLGIRFGESIINNAVSLATAIAYKYYETVLMPIDIREVLAITFSRDDRYARTEIILRSGLRIEAWISIPLDKEKPLLTNFRINSIHRCGEM